MSRVRHVHEDPRTRAFELKRLRMAGQHGPAQHLSVTRSHGGDRTTAAELHSLSISVAAVTAFRQAPVKYRVEQNDLALDAFTAKLIQFLVAADNNNLAG